MRRVCANIAYAMRLVWAHTPELLIVNAVLQVLTKLFSLMNSVWFLNRILKEMQAGAGFEEIAGIALIFLCIRFFLLLIQIGYDNMLAEDQKLKLEKRLSPQNRRCKRN